MTSIVKPSRRLGSTESTSTENSADGLTFRPSEPPFGGRPASSAVRIARASSAWPRPNRWAAANASSVESGSSSMNRASDS